MEETALRFASSALKYMFEVLKKYGKIYLLYREGYTLQQTRVITIPDYLGFLVYGTFSENWFVEVCLGCMLDNRKLSKYPRRFSWQKLFSLVQAL